MQINIPGWKIIDAAYLVLDYNGTIARDGKVPEAVRKLLCQIAEDLEICVLTADTHGTAAAETEGLPIRLCTFPGNAAAAEKVRIVKELGSEKCICIGNGRNDMAMCEAAALSVGIMDLEGMYGGLFAVTDIVCRSMEEGLALILNTKRIIADLRG